MFCPCTSALFDDRDQSVDDRGAGHVILIRRDRDDSLASDMSPSVVERLHVLWWEDSHSASTAPPPAQRAGAVEQVDDVAAAKVEVGFLCGQVVAEGVSQAGPLQGGRDADRGRKRGVNQSRAGGGSGVSEKSDQMRLTPTTASNRREEVRSWERW